MTGSPLVQIDDGIPYSWVLLEPWCALPQGMVFSGCFCAPGIACLALPGAKMAGHCRDTFQLLITLQGKWPRTGLAHRQPAELPRPWAQVEAWRAASQAMLNSGYLCVLGVACLVHLGVKIDLVKFSELTLSQSVDTSVLLRRGNKIFIGGNMEKKCETVTEGKVIQRLPHLVIHPKYNHQTQIPTSYC